MKKSLNFTRRIAGVTLPHDRLGQEFQRDVTFRLSVRLKPGWRGEDPK